MTTHRAASASDYIGGLIIGLMLGAGAAFSIATIVENNENRDTSYTCSSQVKDGGGITVTIDGQAHHCKLKGDK